MASLDTQLDLERDALADTRPRDGLEREIAAGTLDTGAFVRRIYREHLRHRWKLLALSLSSMVFVALTTGTLPFLIQRAADDVFVGQSRTVLYALPLVVIAVIAIKGVAEYVSKVSEAQIGNRVVADLRVRMFEAVTRADLAWLQDTHSGRFVSSFLNDVNLVREAASGAIVGLGSNALKVIVLTVAMFVMDWRLASIAAVLMPVGLLLMGRQRRRMRHSVAKNLTATGDLGRLTAQTLGNIRVVQAYGRQEAEAERAGAVIEGAYASVMQSVRTKAASGPAVEMLTGIGFAGAIFYGGLQGIRGVLTFGEFMGFIAAAMLVYQPLKALASLQTGMQEGVGAAARVYALTDRVPKVIERPGAPALALTKGHLRFEDVSFAYRADEPVLKGFDLDLGPGSRVALVGPSGSGKSTVMNLALRFFDPSSGRITLDGQDVSTVTLASLRSAFALLTQDPVLFDDTIRANIAYGSEGASEAEIEAAARAAAAHDFIARLPQGYDTPVAEGGARLSGGQKQRIAIARAFLKDAPILLLDEPTSALDSEAEAQVQHALDTLTEGRTVLMIAHRLATVRQADRIVVMDEGGVVETGTHDALLARQGRYARFHAAQTREAAPDADAA
ncbi:MAG: ABC transporter ATP-binding protein [Pseudomonadota bacterium]